MKRKIAPAETAKRILERRGAALKVAALGAGAGAVALGVALKRSKSGELHEAVQYLRSRLGEEMTAYLSGEDDAGVIALWLDGRAQPDKLRRKRLQSAYEAARCLVKAYDDQTARSWFLGMNPTLGDESPARLLRNSRTPRVWGDVVLAAREFAET